ncbi:hypothetical protein WJX72_002267 [[Myrmecia] bisecta]|uniref:RecF/RecN/SMC N-terminal domain-containing protein n=1 Tax=[Myrmecia] bisecta TaxID=41462 RepID=A0AAW1R4Y0_9CHLO
MASGDVESGKSRGARACSVCVAVVVSLVLLLAMILLPMSFSNLSYYQMGFKQKRSTGVVYLDKVYSGGRYALGPDYTFYKYESDAHLEQFDALSVSTADKLETLIDFDFVYFLKREELVQVKEECGQDYKGRIRSAGQAAIKNTVVNYPTEIFLGHVQIPELVRTKQLNVAVQTETNKQQVFASTAAVTRKQTKQLVNAINNNATIALGAASAQADLIVKTAQSDALVVVQQDSDSDDDVECSSDQQNAQESDPACTPTEMTDRQAEPAIIRQACIGNRLVLQKISLQGFKSYNEQASIGPLSQFTCVIGPNGCGKSVVGEAIAFALGGNARMLRAKSLAMLLNTKGAQAAANYVAQVTLVFGLPNSNDTLYIRRSLSSRQNETHMRRGTPAKWQSVSQAAVRNELKQHGVLTEVVDRFIVTQNRQAVAVNDSVELLRYIEQLTGTGEYAQRISNKAEEIASASSECDTLADEMDMVHHKRRRLAPEVSKWRQYEADMKVFQAKKGVFLRNRTASLEAEVAELERKVGPETSALEACKEAEEKLHAAADRVDSKKGTLQQEALRIQAQHRKQTHQLESLKVEEARVVVHLKAAADAVARENAQRKRTANRMQQLQADEAAVRKELQTLQWKVARIGKEETDVGADLEALRQKARGRRQGSAAAHVKEAEAAVQKAEEALTSAEAAEASRLAQLQAAEGRVQQLEKEVAAAAQTAQDNLAKEASQHSQAEQLQLQAEAAAEAARAETQHVQQLQQQLVSVQAELSRVQDTLDTAMQAQHTTQAGAASPLDSLVASLMAMSQEGKLRTQGTFYGRLQNLFRVASPNAVTAVNAVLTEMCNMATFLVVSDRDTANHTLSCFQQQRVGLATCKIVAEVATQAGSTSMDSLLNATSDLSPLLLHVEVLPDAPEVQCVLDSMLATWFIAKDRQSAAKAIAADKRPQGVKFAPRNIVTWEGECFKADGEIVSGGGSRKRASGYGLSTDFVPSGDQSSRVETALKPEEKAALRAQIEQLQSSDRQLQEQILEAQQQLHAAEAEQRSSKRALDSLQRSAAAQTAKATGMGSAALLLPSLQAQLKVAQKEAQALRVQAADEEMLQRLHGEVTRMCTKYAELRRQVDGGGELLQAEQRLQALQEQSQQVAAQLIQAQHDLTRLQRQLAKHQDGAAHSSDASATEVAKLKVKASKLTEKIQAAEEAQAVTGQGEQEVQAKIAAAKAELQSTSRALTAAKKRTAKATETLENVTSRLTARKAQLQKMLAALASLPAPSGEGGDAAAGSRGGDSKRQRTASSSRRSQTAADSQATAEDSDSDFENAAGRPSETRAQGHARGRASATEWWEVTAQALADQEEALEVVRQSIDPHVLEEDLAALLRLEAATQELAAAENQLTRAQAAKEALETERFALFESAMKLVNAQLTTIYQRLSGGQGDAYCSYTAEKLMLFADGVTFNVRPDSSKWRPFASLSGGQQSLASLALSFALQAAFPSPFYFFDEIDCALDTANAARVADYICSQTNAQYLVVSHKPQVYERASCLVGVYTLHNSSSAVTLQIPPTPARSDLRPTEAAGSPAPTLMN